MPAYTKCKVAQLRQMCYDRRIACSGLRKHELVEALRHDDDVIRHVTENGVDNVDYNNVPDNGNESDVVRDYIVRECNSNDDDDDDGQALGGDVGEGTNAENGGIEGDEEISGGHADAQAHVPAGDETQPRIEMEIRLERERRETRRMELQAERDARDQEWAIERERLLLSQGGEQPPVVRNNAHEITSLRGMLPTLKDDDVLTFFVGFERILELHAIDRSLWAKMLLPQLSQRAMKVFLRLTSDETKNYDVVKATILAHYRLDAQCYLRKFRSYRRSGGESYKLCLNRLRDLQSDYFSAKQINTFAELADAMVFEQLLNSLPDPVREFVWARKPTTAEECASAADLCFDVSKINDSIPKYSMWGKNTTKGNGATFASTPPQQFSAREGENKPKFNSFQRAQKIGPVRQNNSGVNPSQNTTPGGRYQASSRYQQADNFTKKNPACWSCGQTGHRSAACPQKFLSQGCPMCGNYHDPAAKCQRNGGVFSMQQNAVSELYDTRYVIPTFVNGVEITALRDTGNNFTVLVDPSLVAEGQILKDRKVALKGAFDECYRELPVALIQLKSPHFGVDSTVSVMAAVTAMPDGILCNIGNRLFYDHPDLSDVIRVNDPVPRQTTDGMTTDLMIPAGQASRDSTAAGNYSVARATREA